MPEETKEVKTFMVYYKCDVCKIGYMQPTGLMLQSMPPQFPHKCDNKDCDHHENFTGLKYPRKYYQEVTNA